MTNLAHKIVDYSEHLEASGYASSAIRSYNSRLRGFVNYIDEQGLDHAELIRDRSLMQNALERYGQYLGGEGVKASSVNSIQTAMKGFCRFLGMRRLTLTRQLESPALPQSLDAQQVAKLYEAISSATNLRDKAIAMLILKAGLRSSECAALNTNEISFEGDLCYICTGKAAKSRVIALDGAASKFIVDYLRDVDASESGALFTSKTGARISVASIDLILKNIGRRARLEISARRLRDTFITQLVSSGLDMTDIADLGGTKIDTLKRFYPQNAQVGTPLAVPTANFVLTY